MARLELLRRVLGRQRFDCGDTAVSLSYDSVTKQVLLRAVPGERRVQIHEDRLADHVDLRWPDLALLDERMLDDLLCDIFDDPDRYGGTVIRAP